MRKILAAYLIILSIAVSACASNSSPLPTNTLFPTATRTTRPSQTLLPQPTLRPTITLPPSTTPAPSVTAITLTSPKGIPVSFRTPDDRILKGYFYPASHAGAPVVVMMHQKNGNQTLWWAEDSGFIPWLQNWPTSDGSQPTPSAEGALPLLNPAITFNVLTFDFRGHGESGGEMPQNMAEFIIDARAAYQAARTLPQVDASRIVGIGTSIGADAVVDACSEPSCRGAFSISPGSWLGIDYGQTVSRLIEQGKHVRCMYAVNDGPSPVTCWNITPGDYYQIFSYEGIKHGMTFFVPRKMEIDFGKNIIEFLIATTK